MCKRFALIPLTTSLVLVGTLAKNSNVVIMGLSGNLQLISRLNKI